jgi:hypothetical protein
MKKKRKKKEKKGTHGGAQLERGLLGAGKHEQHHNKHQKGTNEDWERPFGLQSRQHSLKKINKKKRRYTFSKISLTRTVGLLSLISNMFKPSQPKKKFSTGKKKRKKKTTPSSTPDWSSEEDDTLCPSCER